MPQADIYEAPWWRWSRYEVIEPAPRPGVPSHGRIVRPAPEATLVPYDPWELRAQSDANVERFEPAYLKLARLADRTDRSARWEAEVCEWAARFGLLGVFFFETEAITFPARLEYRRDSRGRRKRRDGPLPVTHYLSRGAAGLESHAAVQLVHETWEDPPSTPPGPEREGELVLHGNATPPGWLCRELWFGDRIGPNVERKPVTALGVYFPGVDCERTFPKPGSLMFHRTYAEPLDKIGHAASVFRTILGGLDGEDEVARDRLLPLLQGVRPIVTWNERRRLELRWRAESLLGALAMMLVEDLSRCTPRRCDRARCHSLFLARSPEAKYCSDQCRNTVAAAKHRRERPDLVRKAKAKYRRSLRAENRPPGSRNEAP
jgi:hypothetical protein